MDEPTDNLVDLIPRCRLVGIGTSELVARRGNDVPEGETVSLKPSFTLNTNVSDGQEAFSLRLRVDIENALGDLSAEVEAEYELNEPLELLDEKLVLEFGNHVGVMTLLPYLRQAVTDLTQRVFASPLVMPVFERGQLWFREQHSETGDESQLDARSDVVSGTSSR